MRRRNSFIEDMENEIGDDLPFDTPCDDAQPTKKVHRRKRPATLLDAIENIVDLAQHSALSADFYRVAKSNLKYAGDILGLPTNQTLLVAVILNMSDDSCIRYEDLSQFFGCRRLKIMKFVDDFDALERAHYIVANRRHGLSYRMPQAVVSALQQNKPYVYEQDRVEGTAELFDALDKLFDDNDDNSWNYDARLKLVDELLEQVRDTQFYRAWQQTGICDHDERILFLFMANLFVQNADDGIVFSDIDDLYDQRHIPSCIKRGFRNQSLDLFKANLIECAADNGFLNTERYKLTDHAKETLLCELSLQPKANPRRDLEKAEEIMPKRLVYNAQEERHNAELEGLLSQEKYAAICQRLRNSNLRQGFCVLFYGAPGTGKTETALQLARTTGRDIMRIDVDRVKSKWVGDSEKNIKQVFAKYRELVHSCPKAPILLFNEADAILGTRFSNTRSAVEKMENSIQNIILQEMETLEGIMICTTNLTTSLDSAFERRFLYKVCFHKPTVEARAKIWRLMLPELSDTDARRLAENFELSGGEIENVVRKRSIEAILHGTDLADFDSLADICRHEKIVSSRTRVGF